MNRFAVIHDKREGKRMARIRSIKPAFFTSEDTCRLSVMARLLFIGLWTEADREGRLHDRPGQLKHRLLPSDDCDVDDVLQELHTAGRIRRYRVGGVPVIEIDKFAAHQKPHPKEAPSIIPAFGSGATEIKARPQHVYFILSDAQGRIKIGVSSVPRHRMISLQTGSSEPLKLLGVCEGGFDLEATLHDELATFRRQGEWFDDCQEVRAVIERHTQTRQSREQVSVHPVEHPSSPRRNGSGDLSNGYGVSDLDQEGGGTPRGARQAPLIVSPLAFDKIHGKHVPEFCDWVCLPEFIFAELCRKSGQASRDDGGAAYVRGWAQRVRAEWGDRVVAEDAIKFWRARWEDSHKESQREAAQPSREAVLDQVREKLAKRGVVA